MIRWENSKYSEKTRRFLSKPPEEFPLLTLLDGAVRSGKTLSIIQKIPQIFEFVGNEYLKVFSGYSRKTVKNNVISELKPYIENYLGGRVRYNASGGELDIKLFGKEYSCYVTGAGKSDSLNAIQGGTWDFWYANELPRHNYGFYNMALSRLTPANARAFADSNPESINHWLFQEKIKPYLDGNREVKEVFEYWHFTMRDNANLSDVFIKNQEKLYKGTFKKRKIDGLWLAAEGLVYDTFSKDKHTISNADLFGKIQNGEIAEYFLGIDWGWNHPTVCLLLGNSIWGTCYVIDELYSAKIDFEGVIRWINQKQIEYGKFFNYANCDNARPEQNEKLRRYTNLVIYETKPKVEDSITLVRSLINYDKLIVSQKCVHTLEEFELYSYGSDDIPLKVNDDCMDALRYGLYIYLTENR